MSHFLARSRGPQEIATLCNNKNTGYQTCPWLILKYTDKISDLAKIPCWHLLPIVLESVCKTQCIFLHCFTLNKLMLKEKADNKTVGLFG